MHLPLDMLGCVFAFLKVRDAFNLAHAASNLLVASGRDPRLRRVRKIFVLAHQIPNTLLWDGAEEVTALANYEETVAMVGSVGPGELVFVRPHLQKTGVGWMSCGFCTALRTNNEPVTAWFANLQDPPFFSVFGVKVSFPTYERWVFNQFKNPLTAEAERVVRGSVHSRYGHFMKLLARISTNDEQRVATALKDSGFLTINGIPKNYNTKPDDMTRFAANNCNPNIVATLADALRDTSFLRIRERNRTELAEVLKRSPNRRC